MKLLGAVLAGIFSLSRLTVCVHSDLLPATTDALSSGQLNKTFVECIQKTGADIVLPSNHLRYETARMGRRTRVINRPLAVAYVTKTSEVQQLVRCAAAANIVVTPRSGGHSFESFSTTTGTLVIDISKMNRFTVLGKDTAQIQAGIQLGDFYLAIHAMDSELTFPGGTCPTVGLGGLISSGGYGTIARKFGIGADHILSATVVNSRGELVQASQNNEPDLFWALKGGGGGTFGLVLSYTIKLVKAPLNSMFHITWTELDAIEVIKRWQQWAPTSPDSLNMYFYQFPTTLRIYGHFLGTMQELEQVLQESGLLEIGAPVLYKISCSALGAKMFFNFDDTCQDQVTLASALFSGITKREKSYAKGIYIVREIPKSILIQYQEMLKLAPGITYVNLEPYGGIFSTQSTSMTPFPHRQGILFHIEFGIYVTGIPSTDEIAHNWSKNLYALLLPYSNAGAYQGYADRDLPSPLDSYYGGNVERLVDIKRRYDPLNVFQNNQSIRP